jgi:hypothetical protein
MEFSFLVYIYIYISTVPGFVSSGWETRRHLSISYIRNQVCYTAREATSAIAQGTG